MRGRNAELKPWCKSSFCSGDGGGGFGERSWLPYSRRQCKSPPMHHRAVNPRVRDKVSLAQRIRYATLVSLSAVRVLPLIAMRCQHVYQDYLRTDEIKRTESASFLQSVDARLSFRVSNLKLKKKNWMLISNRKTGSNIFKRLNDFILHTFGISKEKFCKNL